MRLEGRHVARRTTPCSIITSNQTPRSLVYKHVRLVITLALVGLLACSNDDTASEGGRAATTSIERQAVQERSSPDAAVPCPGSVPRRGINDGAPSADALPYVDEAVVDRRDAEMALPLIEGDLRDRYSGSWLSLWARGSAEHGWGCKADPMPSLLSMISLLSPCSLPSRTVRKASSFT